ncbi:MAG: MFS transporter, partial [Acidimicrobiales bacterium]|nr:MFS transporter [Acidimicrobiales bacterium]
MQGRPWRVFALISGAVVQSTLNFSIIFVAFPEIEESFDGVGASRLSWALTGYTIVLAALLVPVGWLADRVGRRRVFLTG